MDIDLDAVRDWVLNQIGDNVNDKITHKLESLIQEIDKQTSLDKDFVELLNILANGDKAELHDVEKYADIVEEIKPNSTVIYFKSAGLVRVYNPEELTKYFINRAVADYKNKNDIYEVIDNKKPQKIIIIVDSRNNMELTKVKNYIIDFSKGLETTLNEKDLIVFDNIHQNTFEIVVKSWIVDNVQEKDIRTKELLSYIAHREKGTELAKKMNTFQYSEVPNAITITAPGIKRLISPFIEDLDGFISQTPNNLIYVNIQAETINNVSGNMTINNAVEPNSDPVEEFRLHLEGAALDWYKTGNVIKYDTIYNEYMKIKEVSKVKFTNLFDDEIYTGKKRMQTNGKRDTYVTLL